MPLRAVSTDCPAVQMALPSQSTKSASWLWSRPGIPMESITVYQKIPHPGIGVNLNGYYAKQVGAVSRESSGRAGSWWWTQVGERQSVCVFHPPQLCD